MNNQLFNTIVSIQQDIYTNNGNLRTDVHYQEGYGAIFVREGQTLHPANILAAVSEQELFLRSHFM